MQSGVELPYQAVRYQIAEAIDLVLRAHEPNPALAYDRHWNLVSANRMVAPLLEGIPQRLLGQPVNILRLAFHPEALAARTVNLAEWCGHLLERLHRQCEATADPELIKLHAELKAYPIPARSAPLSSDNVAIPFRMRFGGDVLSFISTTMIFGTPVDITLSELALETFFPADDLTAGRMRATIVLSAVTRSPTSSGTRSSRPPTGAENWRSTCGPGFGFCPAANASSTFSKLSAVKSS